LPGSFVEISAFVVLINLVLAIFNLIPVPPLDGSKILFALLPADRENIRIFLERNSLILILLVLFFAWNIISPIISILFGLIVG
jgi:Zn-dependent protease